MNGISGLAVPLDGGASAIKHCHVHHFFYVYSFLKCQVLFTSRIEGLAKSQFVLNGLRILEK